jgi:PAS domain S-box-containing protein
MINQEERLNEIIQLISAIASLDFSKKAPITNSGDLIDVIGLGLNMMSEALEESVVSRTRLEASEQKYRNLFSSASDAILVLADDKILECNQKALELLGYDSLDELHQRPITLISTEKAIDLPPKLIEKNTPDFSPSAPSTFLEIPLRKKDGTFCETEISFNSLHDQNGNEIIQAIIRDISKKKKAEKTLRLSEMRFKSLFENAPIGMNLANLKGRFLKVNKAFASLLGYTQKELLGMTFSDIAHPEDDINTRELIRQLAAGKLNTYQAPKRFFHKKGHILHTLLTTSIHTESTGDQLMLSQIVDMTEKKMNEEKIGQHITELEAINQELDQFAQAVSHDLKAPVRGVSILVDFILDDLKNTTSPEILENLRLIKSRMLRMDNLIQGLLEYAQIGRQEGTHSWIEMNELLKSTIGLLHPPENAHIDYPDPLPRIYSFPAGLQQIFQNLIGNALQFNHQQKARVKIQYNDREDFHQFCIEDNGPGIDKAYWNKVFNIFQTLHSRDVFESTGIGLSIVKKRVENLGGKIWIESPQELEGARFCFTIPKRPPIKV